MTKGRLEIQSDIPILGTALTSVGSQLSSLPFLPAVAAYTFTASVGGTAASTGEWGLWLDGPNVQGYGRNLTEGGNPVQRAPFFVTGQLLNGVLRMYTYGKVNDQEFVQYHFLNSFSLSMKTVQTSFTMWYLNSSSAATQGKLSLT